MSDARAETLVLQTGDSARGEVLYKQRCGACHSLNQNRIGPMHKSVYGSKSASVEGFPYSQALRDLNVTWEAAQLDRWLQNPTEMAPGTRMGFRLRDAQARADIIAYLKTISEKNPSD
ncbi:c-type cytochrome [Hyphococcus formosus]|uniref:c-type cytochrome n=1 Tax=Hyphococcus formosus TaxID=3143534 RepID=UPI00398A9D10